MNKQIKNSMKYKIMTTYINLYNRDFILLIGKLALNGIFDYVLRDDIIAFINGD